MNTKSQKGSRGRSVRVLNAFSPNMPRARIGLNASLLTGLQTPVFARVVGWVSDSESAAGVLS